MLCRFRSRSRALFIALGAVAFARMCGLWLEDFYFSRISSGSLLRYASKLCPVPTALSLSNLTTFQSMFNYSTGGLLNNVQSVALFGLHDVKVMPSCDQSDGVFMPPLVSFMSHRLHLPILRTFRVTSATALLMTVLAFL